MREAKEVPAVSHFTLRADWSGKKDMSDLNGQFRVSILVMVRSRAAERGSSAAALRRWRRLSILEVWCTTSMMEDHRPYLGIRINCS